MDETHHLLAYPPNANHAYAHNLPGRHRISRLLGNESPEVQQWYSYIGTLPAMSLPAGVDTPDCYCRLPCCLVHDSVTVPGEEFSLFVCSMYGCTFYQVLWSQSLEESIPREVSEKIQTMHPGDEQQKQADITGMWDLNDELGTLVIDNKYKVDRSVSLWYVLGLWGDSFSERFFDKLEALKQKAWTAENSSTVAYPKGSVELNAHQEYHGFISYRWNSGRSNLHLSFLSVFGMPWMTFIMFIVYPVLAVVLLFSLVKPIDHDKDIFLGRCRSNGIRGYCYLFWFQLIGVFLLIPILLFAAQFVKIGSSKNR